MDQIGPKMEQKWTRNEPKMDQNQDQNGQKVNKK